ncbi:paralemmin-3 [Discoglossus pictus]
MGETLLYSQRLHGITERRSILNEVDKVQRELEQQRLKLQQLKRKSLRDRWLMDGLVPAPGAEIENPLSQTESKIQQLEEELDSLQSRLFSLENPGVNQPKVERVKEYSVPQKEFVNGEREQQATETSQKSEEEYKREADVDIPEEKEEESISLPHGEPAPRTVRVSSHPIPAPRGKKPETPKPSNMETPQNQNPEHLKQNLGILDANQEHPNHNLEHRSEDLKDMDQEHDNQTAEQLNESAENQNLGHPIQNFAPQNQNIGEIGQGLDQNLSVSKQGQNHNLEREVRPSDESIIHELQNNQEKNQSQDTVLKDNPDTILNQETAEEQSTQTELSSQDHIQNQEDISSTENKSQESLPLTEKEDQNQNQSQESLPVTKERIQDLNQDNSQETFLATQDKKEDHIQESLYVTQETHQVLVGSEKYPFITQEQNQGPKETTQVQNIDQIQKQESVSTTEKQNRDQSQNQEPSKTQVQNESSVLLSKDQNHDPTLPAKGEEHNQRILSSSNNELSMDQNQVISENQSTISQSKEPNQVQISQIVVVAAPCQDTLSSDLAQHTSTHSRGPTNHSQQGTSATGGSPPECQPLLQTTQVTDHSSAQGANTAEARGEKIRVKEKTCQCCVVM